MKQAGSDSPIQERSAAPADCDLGCIESFCAWIEGLLAVNHRVGPDDALASLGLDCLGEYQLIAAVEAAVGEPFPDPLVESIVSPRELHEFAIVKASRQTPESVAHRRR